MGRSACCCSCLGTSFEAKHWLSLNFCGLVCFMLSCSVHVYALVVIYLKLLSNSKASQVIWFSLYIPCAVLALSSLFMAWTTNPGAVPMGARPLTTFKRSGSVCGGSDGSLPAELKRSSQRATRRCHKCNDNFKPPRAHHDSVTGRCIVKMDHFCPWVGNAIGAMNHKFFVLFIFYTLCCSLVSLLLIVMRLVHCGYVHDEDTSDNATSSGQEEEWGARNQERGVEDPSRRWVATLTSFVHEECGELWDNYLVLILMICSVIFMIFTCTMLVEQMDAIESNVSKIARMKMSVGQGGTELERQVHDFNEIFGGESRHPTWHWFLPLRVTFPKGMDKIVLGYEWDPSFEPVPYEEPGDDIEEGNGVPRATVVGLVNAKAPPDLEDGLVGVDTSDTVSLGDESAGEFSVSSASIRRKGMRKRETPPSFVGREQNQFT